MRQSQSDPNRPPRWPATRRPATRPQGWRSVLSRCSRRVRTHRDRRLSRPPQSRVAAALEDRRCVGGAASRMRALARILFDCGVPVSGCEAGSRSPRRATSARRRHCHRPSLEKLPWASSCSVTAPCDADRPWSLLILDERRNCRSAGTFTQLCRKARQAGTELHHLRRHLGGPAVGDLPSHLRHAHQVTFRRSSLKERGRSRGWL